MDEICKQIRRMTLECIGSIGSGHIGGSMSIVELLRVLYFDKMNVDPKNPKMEGRDRLIVSKGHAGPAVYATLALKGFFPKEWLYTLNRFGTNLPSHCDMNKTPGVDMTAGSLGQGFSCAVGVAIGSKLKKDGATIYAIVGDGESQEGQIWEAAMFASAKHLDNLIGFTDYNKLQIDGTVAEVNDVAPLNEKWAAFGWNVIDVANGNDLCEVSDAVRRAKANRGSGKPTMVILHTKKGCGMKWAEDLGPANHNVKVPAEVAEAAIRALREEAL